MELNDIVNIISSVGFPIVMCCLMFKTMTETLKNNSEQITKLCDKIDNLIDKLSNK